jgi:hypothetical protein
MFSLQVPQSENKWKLVARELKRGAISRFVSGQYTKNMLRYVSCQEQAHIILTTNIYSA